MAHTKYKEKRNFKESPGPTGDEADIEKIVLSSTEIRRSKASYKKRDK